MLVQSGRGHRRTGAVGGTWQRPWGRRLARDEDADFTEV